MRIIRSFIAPAAALAVASGIAVLPALTSTPPASAQASCTGSSAYDNSANHLVFVPTIGDDTHLDNCELGLGNDSNAVFWLQTTLNFCYGAGLATDGIYGPLTQAAVRHAQTLAGVTHDGIYGPQTRDHIKWGDAAGQCARL
jgi:peptidoglycan hydrolase-like protein with peptidoglycan-binding domain